MRRIRNMVAFAVMAMLGGFIAGAEAQVAYRMSEKEVKNLLKRIEVGADRFRNSLDKSLDVSLIDGTRQEDNINQYIKEFEAATDRLEKRFDDDQSAASDVEEVLRRAARIDNLVMRSTTTQRAQSDWMALRNDLDALASAYNVSWTWAGGTTRAYRLTEEQMKGLLESIERQADQFRVSLADALDNTDFDDTNAEDSINQYIKEFEAATDNLEDRFTGNRAAAGDAEEVLRRAARIDAFMRHHRLTLRAQEDWTRLRRHLDELGMAYTVAWKWDE